MPLSMRRGRHDRALRRDTDDAHSRANCCPHPVRAFRAGSADRGLMVHLTWVDAESHHHLERSFEQPTRSPRLFRPAPTGRLRDCRYTAAIVTTGEPALRRVVA